MIQIRKVPSRKTLLSTALIGMAGSAMLVQPAVAQIDEVVTTAQRREKSVQDVPISVNAYTAEAVEKQRLQEFGDLAVTIPGFSINTFTKSRLNPSLRGGSSSLASAGAEGAVGLFIDDQYSGGPGDFEIDLFDVERIEVLRGPQGTLFGRNTTGGSINVITRAPSDVREGKLEVTAGNYNLVQTKALLTGPITDNLSGLITFATTDRGGTSLNTVTGNDIDNKNKTSVRGKLRYDAGDGLSVTGNLSYTHRDETGLARDAIFPRGADGQFIPVDHSLLVGLGFQPEDNTREVQQFTDGRYVADTLSAGLRFEKDIDAGQLISITAFRSLDTDHLPISLAGAPVPVFAVGEPRESQTWQQEFRFVSAFDGPFNFVGGLFGYISDEGRTINAITQWDAATVGGAFQSITFCADQTEDDFNAFEITPACLGGGSITAGNQTVSLESLFTPNEFTVFEQVETQSLAAYAEGTYELTDQFSILAGGRYTYDRKSLVGGTDGAPDFFWNPQPGLRVDDSETWDRFTWRLGVTYEPTPDILLYGTASTGFRAGVYDVAQSDPALSGRPLDPETATSYEAGFKSRFFNDRLQVNATYFDVTYDNLQFFVNTGDASISSNAGEASVNGVELDVIAQVTDNLTLTGQWSHQNGTSSGTPADAEIADGTPPQGTVPNTIILGFDYTTDMGSNGNELSVSANYTHKDRYGLEFNDVPQFQSEVDALINARISYSFGKDQAFELAAWGKNILDEDIVIYGQDFWFTFYGPATFASNPEIAELTSQPRYADPATYGVTLTYDF